MKLIAIWKNVLRLRRCPASQPQSVDMFQETLAAKLPKLASAQPFS